MLLDRAEHEPDTTAFCTWGDGTARAISWREYMQEVQEVTLGLHDLGVVPGDRVAIMSSARREWVVAALAILSIGGVPVGVYPTSSVPEVNHVLEDSGATAVFVEGTADATKIAGVAAKLRAIIGFDTEQTEFPASVKAVQWASLRTLGRDRSLTQSKLFTDLVDAGDIDQIAALFYTSGSTGSPKGVVHTHRTLQYSVLAFAMSYPEIGRYRHDLVGFLGLSHVAPALVGVFAPIMTRLVVTFCTMDQRVEALVGVRPTAVVWPPRMHEKLASEVLQGVSESGKFFKYKYAAAMEVARWVNVLRWRRRTVPIYLDALYRLCLSQVFIPMREKVGMDRINVSWTASGSMTPDVAALWQMWGVDLRELFGTTETCGSVLAQWDRAFPAPGGIGKSMPDPRWSLRVTNDGELQVRSPSLFSGYWRNPEATASAMNDGWYGTGDLVELDSDGEVKIIGRLKDVLKTSGGKAVSPQPIEIRLKTSPLIDEAIVVGEGRKYLTVLLCVSDEARSMNTNERDAALGEWIDEVNSELARPLQLKNFRVLPRPLSVDAGELTAKATIRRANVLAAFTDLVDDMYDVGEQVEIARQARLARSDRRSVPR
ncbi:AMP-dependent synthetase/ligase [Rhodococcus rhodochrous]|nr:AMP-binding protein [Rhodococcus rhodochrous]